MVKGLDDLEAFEDPEALETLEEEVLAAEDDWAMSDRDLRGAATVPLPLAPPLVGSELSLPLSLVV